MHDWSARQLPHALDEATYRRSRCRTIGIAAAVTVTDALLAFPFAYYMARIAGPRTRTLLFVLVLMPLWSSYLVRVYTWRLILSEDGVLNWWLGQARPAGPEHRVHEQAVWIVFSYIWLPFMILPVYAALERIPDSLIEASRDLGARGWTTFRRVVCRSRCPGVVAGSIFTFSLTLGDYITPLLVGGATRSSSATSSTERRVGIDEQHAVRGRVRDGAARRDGPLPRRRAPAGSVRGALMESRATRSRSASGRCSSSSSSGSRSRSSCVYAFNPSNIQSWPISGFTPHWFRVAWHDQEVRDALWLSLKAALVATAIALVLGTMAAFGVSRFRFFGREAVSFLFVLPLALPGIITGIALTRSSTFWGVDVLALDDRRSATRRSAS